MHIPFITNKKKSPTTLTIGKEISTSKNIASPSERMGIDLIRMEECSTVAGGPQIINTPQT